MSAATHRFRGAKQASLPMDFETVFIYCHGLMCNPQALLDLEQLWAFLVCVDEHTFKRVYMHDAFHDTLISLQAQEPFSRLRLLSIRRALDTGCLSFNQFWLRVKTDFFADVEDKVYFANHMLATVHPRLVEKELERGSLTTQDLSRCANWRTFLDTAVEVNPEFWLIYLSDDLIKTPP
jgi:hypothetical protein